MIKRRQASRKVTYLYDHSVPRELLFQGILASQTSSQIRPKINVAKRSDLSPFIIHLSEAVQSPEEILAEEAHRNITLNLLVPEATLTPPDVRPSPPAPVTDLALETIDVRDQLTEEIPVAQPVRVRAAKRPQQTSTPVSLATHAPAVLSTPLPIHELTPPKPPAEFFSSFALPDDDEEDIDESEAVTLDELFPEEESSSTAKPRLRLPQFSLPSLSVPALSLGFLHLPTGWHRALGGFVLLSFVFVLPLHAMNVVQELREAKDELTSAGAAALADLEAGASAALVQDVAAASHSFEQATVHFSTAQETVEDLDASTSFLLSALPMTQKNYRAGKALLTAGDALSTAGARMADGVVAMNTELNPTPTSRLTMLRTYVTSALPYLHTAEEEIMQVEATDLPAEQQDMLLQLQTQLPLVVTSLEEFVEFSEMAQTILGGEGTKRYLVIFQNNTEIRPTGGFMGSFAEIDVQNGEIVRLNIPGGGTYDLQGSLRDYVIAPQPLQLLKARWEFQDANWFPDFPSSARQMLDFYGASGGPTVDGVIAVNATYVADLLGVLGAIDMPEYGRTITSENFVFEAQKIVELEYDQEENKPKAFIGDLAPKVLERVTDASPQEFLSVLEHLNEGLVGRHVQIYFTDDDLQRRILELGWGGELKWTDGDYLMVVDSNLGGGKTDGVISEDIDVQVHIADDGRITNTVTISRSHQGMQGTLFTGVNNVDYVRLYVPKGSELVSATGFSIPDSALFESPDAEWIVDDDLLYSAQTETRDPESGTQIYEESGKTVFGNWIQTKPGTTSTVQFVYELPFRLETIAQDPNFYERVKAFIGVPQTEHYTLTIQKQSGVLDRETTVQVTVPDTLTTLWSTSNLEQTTVTNATDAIIAALFEYGT